MIICWHKQRQITIKDNANYVQDLWPRGLWQMQYTLALNKKKKKYYLTPKNITNKSKTAKWRKCSSGQGNCTFCMFGNINHLVKNRRWAFFAHTIRSKEQYLAQNRCIINQTRLGYYRPILNKMRHFRWQLIFGASVKLYKKLIRPKKVRKFPIQDITVGFTWEMVKA